MPRKIFLTFNFRKRRFKHVPIPDDNFEEIEDFRTRGSEILKAITTAPEPTTTRSPTTTRDRHEHKSTSSSNSNENEKDLHALDKKGNKIQQQQQQQQKRQQRIEDSKEDMSSSSTEWQKKVNRLKYLKRTIELARRKRYDNEGSFAINMVTHRECKNTTNANINEKGIKCKDKIFNCSASRSGGISGYDDRSRSSATTCVSNDFTLQVIDEKIAY
jgi:hypothetical protein